LDKYLGVKLLIKNLLSFLRNCGVVFKMAALIVMPPECGEQVQFTLASLVPSALQDTHYIPSVNSRMNG
jgi:hypothetical protein